MGMSNSRFVGSIRVDVRLPGGAAFYLTDHTLDRLAAELATEASFRAGPLAKLYRLYQSCEGLRSRRATAEDQLGQPSAMSIPSRRPAARAERRPRDRSDRPLASRRADVPKLSAELAREVRLLSAPSRPLLAIG